MKNPIGKFGDTLIIMQYFFDPLQYNRNAQAEYNQNYNTKDDVLVAKTISG